jgi:hypothetical protein
LECQLHSQSQLWVARQGQGTNLTAHHYPQSHLQAVADLLVEWLSSLSWAAWQVLQTMQACLQAASGVLFLVLLAQGLQLLVPLVLQALVAMEGAQLPRADHRLLGVDQRDLR